MDASSIGAIAALLNTTVPAKKFGLGEDYSLPISDIPLAMTSVEFGGVVMSDPDSDEESIADTKLHSYIQGRREHLRHAEERHGSIIRGPGLPHC